MKKIATKKLMTFLVIFLIIAALIGTYVSLALEVALPRIDPVIPLKSRSYVVPSNSLPWPAYGQSAIGLNNLGVIATNGVIKPSPMASTAKLITALCVLKKYPLSAGEAGPTITMTAGDVAIYNNYQSEGGSDMLVVSGEKLSEYQMLQAMLLPSADNIADSLAIWAFGSLSSYTSYANQYVKANNLDGTHIGVDASGFDPSTTSTAADLVKIAELTMNNPILASIVGEPSASGFPVVGNIKNVNALLGRDSIVGIKTGNTDQAGGVYVSASKILVNNQMTTLITAIMQAPSLFDAMYGSLPLIEAAQANFSTPPAIASTTKGSVVGQYLVPWNRQIIDAVASQPTPIKSWGGSSIEQSVSLKSINVNAKVNQVVGSITTRNSLLGYSNTSSALLAQAPTKPSNWWKILHPLSFIHI